MHSLRSTVRLSSRRIATLRYEDVARVDPRTKYVDVNRVVALRGCHRCIHIDDRTAAILEDYLNAQPPGRAFADYRPEIGPYLFPSPKSVTGASPLSHWSVNHILRSRKESSTQAEKKDGDGDGDGDGAAGSLADDR